MKLALIEALEQLEAARKERDNFKRKLDIAVQMIADKNHTTPKNIEKIIDRLDE